MQSELSHILAPSGISATWLSSNAPRNQGDDFPALVVIRFSGACGFEGVVSDAGMGSTGGVLAETDTIDGHVLPFSRVNCEKVRDLIAPSLGSMPPDWKTEMLGRALARVSAHEIYHMLAGVRTHDDRGIFQSGHSRRNLTAASFSFAATQTNWLRGWLRRQTPAEPAVRTVSTLTPSASDDPAFGESDSVFAGR